MRFGHSRPSAFTQMLLPYALRSLQTSCIYPKAFSSCSSVTLDLLHLPKSFFFMLFGHSRPPAFTQMPFPHALRSLQPSYIYPKAFSICSSVIKIPFSFINKRKKPRNPPWLNVIFSYRVTFFKTCFMTNAYKITVPPTNAKAIRYTFLSAQMK
jgi:hypothetical protein